MHPDLERLIPLQAMDLQAKALREEIAGAPRRVAKVEEGARAADRDAKTLAAEIAKEESLRRGLESEIADLRVKLERNRKKADAATTPVQVTALEHEAAFARAEVARLEDRELESMERSEALEARLPAAEQQVRHTAELLASGRRDASELLHRSRAALADLEKRRGQLRGDILAADTGEASLAHYDRIAGHRGTAISEAMLGKCSACGMMVRPQLWQDLRDNSADSPSRESLMSCENCGRLLYYDPARDAPQRKPVQGESIAASIARSSI